eukprot:gene12690-13899_t
MLRLLNALLVFCLATLTFADQTQISFRCTGQLQTYTIPVNVTRISATVCGAFGGGSYGGKGQCLSLSEIPVTPGQVLYIAVGCAGGKSGGYNGGGAGSGYGFGGGGASDIRTQASNLTSRIVVAAGGGGTGYDGSTYNIGGSGGSSSGSGSGYGGLAKLNAGGAGGKYFGYPNGYSGVFGVGGAASSNGGGGGGGWYGGGGATYNGGGGGGSTYYSVGTRTSISYSSGFNGSVIITPYTQYTMTLTNETSSTTVYFPSDVISIDVVIAGAQGGSSSMGQGGKGAYISATITGSFFNRYGVDVTVGGTNGKTSGGMPTSSAYCRLGGVGGGYSSISSSVILSSSLYRLTVLLAGGGGGAGFDPYCGKACNSSSINGGSGGPTGSNGGGSPAMKNSYGGKGSLGALSAAGGFYNSTYNYGGSGSWKQGGSPASDTCGGGGGGGYYSGGGGGSFTGGGGGSSYYYPSVATNVVQAAGTNTGGGYVTFTYWSAMNLQPTFRPTAYPTVFRTAFPRAFPTAFPVITLSDTSTNTSNEEYAEAIIIPICAVCGWLLILLCLYYYVKNHFVINNRTTGATYRAMSLPTTTVAATATVRRVGPRKIDSAVTIMNQFLSSMMGARDRCSIVSFSDKYNIRQNLSSSAPCIASLNACRTATGGGTALYDAAVASVVQFAATADRTRPWLLIILTDGEDTNSRTKPSELIEVLKLFNQASSNFVFVVGLGASLQDTELRRICEQSKSLYLRANDIETMQLMFALIALVVIEQNQVQIARVQAEGVDAIFARARTARAVATIPIDMIILLDTSGSMNEST